MADEKSPVILCGKCRVTPEPVAGAQGDSALACPVCGQTDESSDALREALAQAVNESIRKTAGPNIKPTGKGFVDVSVQRSRQREFRWVFGE